MGRRRSRSRRRGGKRVSRRKLVSGGLIALGVTAVLGGTEAFSQTTVPRAVGIDTSDQSSALLGVNEVASVQQASNDQTLATITNNIDKPLDVSVGLVNPAHGSVSQPFTQLTSGDSMVVTVSVASDAPTGTDTLPFNVAATNDDVEIHLTRSIGVTTGPSLEWFIDDQSNPGQAVFDVDYTVKDVSSFDRVEVEFNNTDVGTSETVTGESMDGVLSYSVGEEGSDEFDITISVFNTSGVVLQKTRTVTADGVNEGPPPKPDPDDPQLDSFEVSGSAQGFVEITVNYELANTNNFGVVEATFKNQSSSWATRSDTDETSPSGSITYQQGGVGGDTYDIIVEVLDTNGNVTHSGTVTIQASGSFSTSWP